MRKPILLLYVFTLVVSGGAAARAQSETALTQQATAAPVKLDDLLAEAERNNPHIEAVRRAWRAAQQFPSQISTLPDPQFMVQQFSVGSPRPFAGYSNSDFAYIGFGVSQDFPYPGKLRLRGEVARRGADAAEQRYESVRRSVLAELKAAYYRLGLVGQTLTILESDAPLLEQVEQAAEARYRAGMGNQQEVIQAQLEKTKLLREVTTRRFEWGQLQARLKQLLNRSQSSADLPTPKLLETPLGYSYEQLLAAKDRNPEIAEAEKTVEKQNLQVELARKDFYPDFNLQYMWQHNADQFRDYYMLTFGIRIPIHRARRQRPELAQAEEELNRSRRDYEAQTQQVAFELQDQYLTAQKTAELLKIYREGLVPQAHAEFQAALAAYQANREDFQAMLASFLDLLRLDEEYWQSLFDHETSLARIEQLTGLSLR